MSVVLTSRSQVFNSLCDSVLKVTCYMVSSSLPIICLVHVQASDFATCRKRFNAVYGHVLKSTHYVISSSLPVLYVRHL